VPAQVDERNGRPGQGARRLIEIISGAGQGQHGTVVVGIGMEVEQASSGGIGQGR
jgi:hypothetical protein